MNHQTLHKDPDCQHVIGQTLQALADLDRFWGNAQLGLELSRACFEKQPLSTDDLAEACQTSRETVRRWLRPLMNVDRVVVIKEGRNIRYRARTRWARLTCDSIWSALGNLNN